MRVEFESECDLFCTDNDKTAKAQVLNFRLHDGLTCYLAESKIIMKYNKQHDVYIGNLFGREFTTKGPKYYEVKSGRNR